MLDKIGCKSPAFINLHYLARHQLLNFNVMPNRFPAQSGRLRMADDDDYEFRVQWSSM